MTVAKTRRELLRTIAAEIQKATSRFTLVAVDGVDGSGKTTFAHELARFLEQLHHNVLVIHLDDFLNVRQTRHRLGKDSAEGFWLDSYDYERFELNVLHAFGKDGTGRFRKKSMDLATDSLLEEPWQQAIAGTTVIVEGMFLHRDNLAKFWDFSIFLDVPFNITAARMAQRDGSSANPEDPSMRRYVEGQKLYFAACQPWSKATVVINNSDPSKPLRIDAP